MSSPTPNQPPEIQAIRGLIASLQKAPDDRVNIAHARLSLVELTRDLPTVDVIDVLNFLARKIVPARIVVDLNNNTAIRDDIVLKLAPKYAEVLSVLVEAYPNAIPIKEVRRRVWGSHVGDDRHLNTARVLISHLRNHLIPLSASIEYDRNRGYRLELF